MQTGTSCSEILDQLKALAKLENVAGMARFGISPQNTLGISITVLRQIGKGIRKDHELAGQLWASGIHEARILASLIDNPKQVSETQMDVWAADFNSWDICDQCCSNLFTRTGFAYQKAGEWIHSQQEFVKRAGFVLMADLAVQDKKGDDKKFEEFLIDIKSGVTDNRNYVKKAVNWALRQIGKRSMRLNIKAIELAEEVRLINSHSARWIATDALRELRSPAVQSRLSGKK
jgi:3-methyladenine DNA glycosylase AlkD